MQPIFILQPLSAAAAEIEVPTAGKIKVGREASNDFVFPDDSRMSSSHFVLSAEAGGCRVLDLASSNGLYLNTKRITNALLVEGDELQAGESRWRVAVRGAQVVPYTSEISVDQSRAYAPSVAPPTPARTSTENPAVAPTDLQLTSDRGVTRRLSPSETLTVGRTDLADWVFDHDGQMSSLHLELFHQSGTWRVRDRESCNGTFLNESRIGEARLQQGDEIRGGQSRFVVTLLPSPVAVIARPAKAAPLGAVPSRDTSEKNKSHSASATHVVARVRRVANGREYDLLPGKITELGRGLALPISLADDLEVSTQHATLLFDGQFVQLRDTGSFNGTYVAGKRIATQQLADGERFRVGQTEMQVSIPSPVKSIEPANPYQPPIAEVAEQPPRHDSTPQISVLRLGLSSSEAISDILASPAAKPPPPPEISDADTDSLPAPGEVPVNPPPAEFENTSQESTSVETSSVERQPNEPQPTLEPQPTTLPLGERDATATMAAAIDWEQASAYTASAGDLAGVMCRSGLNVYRGLASSLDPVDVSLRVLQTTSGWVLGGGEIENWLEAAGQGLGGLPREWLNPARSDDASWMLPFLSRWGSGQAWLVFSSVELDDALQNLLSMRSTAGDGPPLIPALTPTALAHFLAEHDPRAVQRFFAPFDAILVEVHAGQHWALFSRNDLQQSLRQ